MRTYVLKNPAGGMNRRTVITFEDLNDTAALVKALRVISDEDAAPPDRTLLGRGVVRVIEAFAGTTTLTLDLGDFVNGATNLIAALDLKTVDTVQAFATPTAFQLGNGPLGVFTATVENLDQLTAGQLEIYSEWIDVGQLGGGGAASPANGFNSFGVTLTTASTSGGSIATIDTVNGGDALVDWGDGVRQRVACPASNLAHTYAATGSYGIRITAVAGDSLKQVGNGEMDLTGLAVDDQAWTDGLKTLTANGTQIVQADVDALLAQLVAIDADNTYTLDVSGGTSAVPSAVDDTDTLNAAGVVLYVNAYRITAANVTVDDGGAGYADSDSLVLAGGSRFALLVSDLAVLAQTGGVIDTVTGTSRYYAVAPDSPNSPTSGGAGTGASLSFTTSLQTYSPND